MPRRNRDGVTIPDLKLGMSVVTDLFSRTQKPVPVRSRGGRVLALVVPETEFRSSGLALERVNGETFRKDRVARLYRSYWGHAWLVEQRGGNFVVFPPEGREAASTDTVAKGQRHSAVPVRDTVTDSTSADLVRALVDLSGKIGALVTALESGHRRRSARRTGVKVSVTPAS